MSLAFFRFENAQMPDTHIKVPRWFWSLVVGAAAWMTWQTIQTGEIRAVQSEILKQHEKRLERVEDRVDELTSRLFKLEAK